MVSPMPLLQEDREPGSTGHHALHRHPGLGEPDVQGEVAPRGEQPVDVDEVLHIGDLGAEHDAVVRQSDRFGRGC